MDPSAPENSSRLPHQRLVERSIPGTLARYVQRDAQTYRTSGVGDVGPF
jgi:hypothetical protein